MVKFRTMTAAVGIATAVSLGAVALPAGADAAPTPSVAAPAPVQTSLPVSGAVTDTVTGAVTTFTGAVSNLTASVVNGVLTLSGTLTGTGLPAAGVPFAVPLQATGSCTILTLDLGPIHLDLLGLVVDLNAIHLTITAQQGPGNLLGNLLCAVAGLLDNGAGLQGIAGVLNQLLTALGL